MPNLGFLTRKSKLSLLIYLAGCFIFIGICGTISLRRKQSQLYAENEASILAIDRSISNQTNNSNNNYNLEEINIESESIIETQSVVVRKIINDYEADFLKNYLNKDFSFYHGRVDSQRMLRIYDFVWPGVQWESLLESYAICLATQSSIDRIYWIPNIVENFRGPVSLSIYIASKEEWIGLNALVKFFKRCYPLFRDFVSIHVALPIEIEDWEIKWEALDLNKYSTEEFLKSLDSYLCEDPETAVREVKNRFQVNEDAKELLLTYPQNHMRNIAKMGCGTEWIFSSNIDIVPKKDSAILLQEFITTNEGQTCGKCAFVIPTFEMDAKQTFPESKLELIHYVNMSLAKPLHIESSKKYHGGTDNPRWISTNVEEEPVKISHPAEIRSTKYYEPFYISPFNIPSYQEQFVGYGYTRSSQIQEAIAEGWNFKVLTPVYAIQWGLQSREPIPDSGYEIAVRDKQIKSNKRRFISLLKELEARKKINGKKK